jgi:hypothetical protein
LYNLAEFFIHVLPHLVHQTRVLLIGIVESPCFAMFHIIHGSSSLKRLMYQLILLSFKKQQLTKCVPFCQITSTHKMQRVPFNRIRRPSAKIFSDAISHENDIYSVYWHSAGSLKPSTWFCWTASTPMPRLANPFQTSQAYFPP